MFTYLEKTTLLKTREKGLICIADNNILQENLLLEIRNLLFGF